MTATQTLDIIAVEEARSLCGLFQERVRRTPDVVAYQQFDRERQCWQDWTWQDMAECVMQWQRALHSEGLRPGERVAILLQNSVEWVCFDQAALALGLVVVPLYTTDTPGNIAYILADCGARLLLLGDTRQWQSLAAHRDRFPDLQRVLCVDAMQEGESADAMLRPARSWLDEATASPPGDYPCEPTSLATLVYTSGTTGLPKGVMLSHRNILANAGAVLKVIPAYREDVFLSFLPLSHAFERTVGYYIPMMAGSRVAYARSIKELADDLLTVAPTILVSVPRIYEKVYAKVQAKLKDKGAFASLLSRKAEDIGWQRFQRSQGRLVRLGLLDRLLWPLLKKLVADKILARLGGRLRIAVSGGAPLSEPIAHFFIGLGVPLLQGYGLTEAAPVVSGNLPEANEPASVGKLLPGVEIAPGAEGELLLRSNSVMLGYWQREEATREAIDEDGWLHTGDIAEMHNGYLYIRGRLKEVIVTSTGEKASPADLELAITLHGLFEQAMVIGEGKPFLAAVLVLETEAWRQLANELGVDADDPASLQADKVTQKVLHIVAGLLVDFPAYAQVRKVYLTLQPWTIDNGLITPTMKLKRETIQQQFATQIATLYAGHALPAGEHSESADS